jgi:Uma2 family endonuclease
MATVEDVLRIDASDDRICELVDGVLVEKVMGSYESLLAGLILTELNLFLRAHPIGVALGADGMLRILPQRIRIPDVSFLAWERFPDGKLPSDRVYAAVPDLAVEVLSSDNTEREMKSKLDEYFRAGVRLVWYVNPLSKSVDVFHGPETMHRLTGDDILDGGAVLPGFTLPLQELFGRFQ